MKRAPFWAVFFFLFLMAQSCKKESTENLAAPAQSANIITATVSPGQPYIYTAGYTGTMSISRQALHYQISEVGIDNKNGAVTYTYLPAVGYKGTDEVTLMHTLPASDVGNGGCQGSHNRPVSNSSQILIKLNVAD